MTLTLSGLPTLPKLTPHNTIFFHFVSTSTSPIQTLTFTVRLISLRSAAAKVATVLVPMTGRSFGLERKCSTSHPLPWRLLLTRCTLTHVLILHIILPPSQETCLCTSTQKQNTSSHIPDKRSWISLLLSPIFSFSYGTPRGMTVIPPPRSIAHHDGCLGYVCQ